jgi:hypothetical protein
MLIIWFTAGVEIPMVAMLNHLKNGDGDWDDWRQGECVLPALVSLLINIFNLPRELKFLFSFVLFLDGRNRTSGIM